MKKMFLGIAMYLLLGLCASSATDAWAQSNPPPDGYERVLQDNLTSGINGTVEQPSPVAQAPSFWAPITRPFWRFVGWVMKFTSTDAWAQSNPPCDCYDRTIQDNTAVSVTLEVTNQATAAPSFWAPITRPFWRFVGWLMKFTATDAFAQSDPVDKEYDRALSLDSPPVLHVGAVAEAPSFWAPITRPFWRFVGFLMKFTATDAWAQSGSTGCDNYENPCRVVHQDNPTVGFDVMVEEPSQLRMSSYPNPFNPEATIRFDVIEAQQVRLAIFNLLGREVALLVNGRVEVGRNEVRFQAGDLPSGTYLIRLVTATDVVVRKMVLMK